MKQVLLTITLLRSYPKLEDGKRKLDAHNQPITVFVYKVTGSKDALKEYERVQTANDVKTIKDEDENYLYFTTTPCGAKGKLGISVNDKVYVDTTALDLANAMIKSHGAAGTLMARDILKNGMDTQPEPAEDSLPIDKQ